LGGLGKSQSTPVLRAVAGAGPISRKR
jgi:hypothetical protein